MRHFPPSSKTSVPPDPASVRGKQYQSALPDWAGSPWAELRFSIPQPQCYRYEFESQGTGDSATATATAHGDLDGDGKMSTYRLHIVADENFQAKVGRTMEKVDPEE
jgi:hypothetical protein